MSNPIGLDTGFNPIGFYPYDKALKEFFTMNMYPDVENITLFETIIPVMGPPKIELASQQQLQGIVPDQEIPALINKDNYIVKLPAMSITQLNWTFDLSRWTKAHYRKLGWVEDGNKVLQMPTSIIPVDVLYQLDCWTKYRTSMNQMVRNIMLKFANREVWLPIDLKGAFGKKYIALQLMMGGPTNVTEIEPNDKDRTVRMVFTFKLKAWIIPDPVMIPTIRKIIYEIYIPNKPGVEFPTEFPTYPSVPDWLYEDWIPAQNITVNEIIPEIDVNP